MKERKNLKDGRKEAEGIELAIESQEQRLTMSVIMQSRASFSNGKAVGVDGISAEILKCIPWRSLQKIKKTFEMRYKGRNKEDIETWLRNIIVLIPKKKVIDRLEGQTRGICVESVLAKWYCGCLTIKLEMEIRNVERRDKSWVCINTFGFEEGRSATEISTATRLMAAAARVWWAELGVITCSTDVKQPFDNVSPENLSLVMKEMDIAPVLAGAILREQISSKYDICFQETRISGIHFDRSIKQGGKESPCLLSLLQNVARKMEWVEDGRQDEEQ